MNPSDDDLDNSDNDLANEEDKVELELFFGHIVWLIVGVLLVSGLVGLVAGLLGHGHR